MFQVYETAFLVHKVLASITTCWLLRWSICEHKIPHDVTSIRNTFTAKEVQRGSRVRDPPVL